MSDVHFTSGALDSFHASKPAVRRVDVFGLPLDACTDLEAAASAFRRNLAAGTRFLVTFINPSCVALDSKTPRFAKALARFDMVLPDGIGLSKAAEILNGVRAQRISFDSTSLALAVFKEAVRRDSRVLLMGGTPGVAQRAAKRIRESYPDLRIVGALDGYGPRDEKIAQIIALAPDVIVCGMGAIAQEEMLLDLADAGWCGCGFTCGGYLDQLYGGLRYYPGWIDAMNLRWAYRLAREPRRLGRRYFGDYPQFFLAFLKQASEAGSRHKLKSDNKANQVLESQRY
jgi:N-acetylglucosaminyldiphosphoundecaprenol N-acetyl-beta-D-mannosaminyltransferase